MTLKKKIDFNKISKTRKILVLASLVVFTIWGLIASVMSIIKFQNYFHPYLFGFCFGAIGLIIGIKLAIRLKPYVCVSKKMYSEYLRTPISITVGFIGTLLFLGVILNQSLSYAEKCSYYRVVDKTFRQGSSKQPSTINLLVDIDGKITVLSCNEKYWKSVQIGQQIKIGFYKSKIGFDYVILNDEK